jgi:hypothetical protein
VRRLYNARAFHFSHQLSKRLLPKKEKKMSTDEVVPPEKSPVRELLALLLSPGAPGVPLPDLKEIREIIEISAAESTNEAAQ